MCGGEKKNKKCSLPNESLLIRTTIQCVFSKEKLCSVQVHKAVVPYMSSLPPPSLHTHCSRAVRVDKPFQTPLDETKIRGHFPLNLPGSLSTWKTIQFSRFLLSPFLLFSFLRSLFESTREYCRTARTARFFLVLFWIGSDLKRGTVWKQRKCKPGTWRGPTAWRGRSGLWIRPPVKKVSATRNGLLLLGTRKFVFFYFSIFVFKFFCFVGFQYFDSCVQAN